MLAGQPSLNLNLSSTKINREPSRANESIKGAKRSVDRKADSGIAMEIPTVQSVQGLQEKKVLLNERKRKAQERLRTMLPKDLLVANLYHLENPPQTYVKGMDIFSTVEECINGELDQEITQKFTSRAARSIGVANSILILSSLLDFDNDMGIKLLELKRMLEGTKTWKSFDELTPFQEEVVSSIERMCLQL